MSRKPSAPEPVFVIESIPVKRDHSVDRRAIKEEAIPTPKHLAIEPELGRGGMGRIHPAVDKNLLRKVALKRLDRNLAKTPMYREGFIAEAQITGQLEHPNIVPVHDLDIGPKNVPYFTMKLVQGMGLDEWLRDPFRAPGSRERIHDGLEIFIKVCDAIAYAHHRGVIHRDLKPENIMIADFGQVYLMDWGLARLTRTQPASGARSQMNAPGAVGTPTHMAPEQARGNPAEMDERSDIFGLGAVLYEIVSGRTPYGYCASTDEVLNRARAGKVVFLDAEAMRLSISKRLQSIVNKAIQPDPRQRYQTALELRDDVRAFLRGGLHLPTQVFEPGQLILREGDVGDAAYMIVSGQCRAFRNLEGGTEELALMKAGDVFGEMALLLEEPRAASVEAVDQVTLLVLDKKTMTEELGVDGWTSALVRALAARFRDLEHQVRESGMRRG